MSIYGWKIATTEAGLATGSMRSLGLRKLQTAPYRDHTQVVPQGDGGEAEDGFKELNLVFRNVTRMAAAQLQELIDIALAGSGLIYLTVDRNNATAAGRDWVDISAVPHRIRTNAAAPIDASQPTTHTTIEFSCSNVTVLNTPSDYV
jgi:hypothetical protein